MASDAAALSPEAVQAGDPDGILALLAGLGGQLRAGYAAATIAEGLPSAEGIRSVVVCGMGGSGIAGDVVRALFEARLPFPITVIKDYTLPEFCGRDSLVITVSFSGGTEETGAAFGEALERGCRMVAISAGGELAARSAAEEVAHVPIPPETPPIPRAALGHLAGSVIGVLEALGVIPATGAALDRAAGLLGGLASELGPEAPEERNEAKRLARWLGDRVPVMWGSDGIGDVAALRWKTQFNENAKAPAFRSTVPELDHNEIEGWTGASGRSFAGIALRHRGEHARNARRLLASAEVAGAAGLEVREVNARGTDPVEQLFSLILVGDLVSVYLALLRGVDPAAIPTIAGLKERLRG